MAINIISEPSTNIALARSPVIYKFSGINSAYTYSFELYASLTPVSGNTAYVTIDRFGDTNGIIIIDAGKIVRNFINNNFKYTEQNLVYITGQLVENNVDTVVSKTKSDTAPATLGYSLYGDRINYSIITDMGCSPYTSINYNYPIVLGDFSMAEYIKNVTLSIPTTKRNDIAWSSIEGFNYKFNALWYIAGTSGATANFTLPFPTGTTQLVTIPCSHYSLSEDYIASVDITRPIFIKILNDDNNIMVTYTVNPKQCNGNNIYTVKFLNRFGTWDYLHFDGRVDAELNVEYDTYSYTNVDYDNLTYKLFNYFCIHFCLELLNIHVGIHLIIQMMTHLNLRRTRGQLQD